MQQRPFHRRNPPHTAAGWASGQHSLHLGQICSPTQPKTQKPGLGQIPPPPPDPKGRGRQACVWGGRVPGTLQQLQPHPSADDPGSIGTSGAPRRGAPGCVVSAPSCCTRTSLARTHSPTLAGSQFQFARLLRFLGDSEVRCLFIGLWAVEMAAGRGGGATHSTARSLSTAWAGTRLVGLAP